MSGFHPYPKEAPRDKKAKKPLKRSFIKYKPRESGQLEFFLQLWKKKPHKCSVCGKKLEEFKDEDIGDHVGLFSHLLPKKTYRQYELVEYNLEFMCFDLSGKSCHELYHNHPKSELIKSPEWKRVFDKYETLKQQYNKKFNGR